MREGATTEANGHFFTVSYGNVWPLSWKGVTKKNYINPLQRISTMYAVLVTGGKQYRVMQGETLRVEKLEAEAGSDLHMIRINGVLVGSMIGLLLGGIKLALT